MQLTGRERPTAQARVLRALGIPFRQHPTDRVLIVSRAAAAEALGASAPEAAAETAPVYDVDVDAIKNYGKTANPS
jgi:hypothetical protein